MFGVRCHDCQGAGACTSCFLTGTKLPGVFLAGRQGKGGGRGGGRGWGARCLSGQGMTGPIIKHHLVWPSHVSECECLLQEEDGNQRDDKRMTLGQSLVHVESKGPRRSGSWPATSTFGLPASREKQLSRGVGMRVFVQSQLFTRNRASSLPFCSRFTISEKAGTCLV